MLAKQDHIIMVSCNPTTINYNQQYKKTIDHKSNKHFMGQNQSKIVTATKRTQKKALQILNFNDTQESVDYLYKESKIHKLKSIIKTNSQLVYDKLKNNLPNF